jgi:DNA helicase-2/ATP-dependent DNA helicase PcrA
MDFEKDLTPAQREAVTHVDGPLLVIAGAGSGKTRVITYRISYLIKQGIPAPDILAITFTNKAADEMRMRIRQMFSQTELEGMWATTFHSMCARILRREATAAGYGVDYTIYDEDDQLRLIKNVMKDLNIDPASFKPPAILGAISSAKNDMITAAAYKPPMTSGPFGEVVKHVYSRYQAALKDANAMDFDDLLLNTAALFQNNPAVLEKYQDRFKYILIDEYQDTNKPQYLIVRLLAEKYKNICVTGDPDQSIYGWRGADIGNILRFEENFPGAKVVKLEENFRSTKRILACADKLIKNNRRRKQRGLFTNGSEGARIRTVTLPDAGHEAAYIVSEIEKMLLEGRKPRDFGVLYRISALSRNLETALLNSGIPYAVIGSVSFYQRKEIKDILAYLRVIQNPDDEVSLRRIINVPPRKIGDGAEAKLLEAARTAGISMFRAACDANITAQLGPAGKHIAEFAALMERLASGGTCPVKPLVESIIKETDYVAYLKKSETEEQAEDKTGNIGELVNAAAEFDRESVLPELGGFLEQVSLVADIDRWESAEDRVALMTLHSAKGLEFPVVFLVGMEEGIFPHHRAFQEEPEMEEERRLCYVGITRARQMLYTTNTLTRMFHGENRTSEPSRFLREMPGEAVEKIDLSEQRMYFSDSDSTPRGVRMRKGRARSEYDDVPSIDYDSGMRSEGGFKVGDRVKHAVFGQGVVAAFHGDGQNVRVWVKFQQFGEKNLVLRLAGLTKV